MQPTVCCVMLVNGREEMVARAIRSFHSQTYEGLALFCLDTGERQVPIMDAHGVYSEYYPGLRIDRYSVGKLRNAANDFAKTLNAEIILHWDSDDWSHPNRIAEQVALLQSSGKQAVGYRDLLFWKQEALKSYTSTHRDDCDCGTCGPGQRTVVVGEHGLGSAWLYSNPDQSYCVGTSLCYWRSVWEARPFPDLPKKKKGGTGEDVEWLRVVDSLGVTSLAIGGANPLGAIYDYEARMIASIHGDNTQYYGADLIGASTSWKRAPEFDAFCREKMAL